MENINGKRGNRYNIGSGNKIAIKDLANLTTFSEQTHNNN